MNVSSRSKGGRTRRNVQPTITVKAETLVARSTNYDKNTGLELKESFTNVLENNTSMEGIDLIIRNITANPGQYCILLLIYFRGI